METRRRTNRNLDRKGDQIFNAFDEALLNT